MSEIKRLKDRIDSRLNNYLCEMKEGYDDSITGFNEAWDLVRKAFLEALEPEQEGVEATEGQVRSERSERANPSDPIREEMARALERIIATPSMPFPDPGAHSWRAWGSAVYSAWQQIQFTARTALSLHRGK